MTNSLKCPFCSAELKTDVNLLGYSTKYWYCENTSCVHLKDSMREDVWQALIDCKKAQDALKVATDCLYEIYKDYDISGYCEEFISRTLDKIASITTQEKE